MFENNVCVFAQISHIFCRYAFTLDFFVAVIRNISTVNYVIRR